MPLAVVTRRLQDNITDLDFSGILGVFPFDQEQEEKRKSRTTVAGVPLIRG